MHADHFAVVAGELVHLVFEAIDGEEDSALFVGFGDSPFGGGVGRRRARMALWR